MRKLFVFLATASIFLTILASACGPAKATNSTPNTTQPTSSTTATSTPPPSSMPALTGQSLANTSWVLVSYGDPANPTAALPQAKVTLSFNADTTEISGNGGVNGYGGSVVRTDNQLAISGILHTEMASTDQAVNAQENAYFQLLAGAQSVSFGTGTLTINCAGGKVMVFAAA